MVSDAADSNKQRDAIVEEVMRRHQLVETVLWGGRRSLRGITPLFVLFAIGGAMYWWFGPKEFMSFGSTPIMSLVVLAACYSLFDSSASTRRINAIAKILELSGALSKFESEAGNLPSSPGKVPWPTRIGNET